MSAICPLSKDRIQNHPPVQQRPSKPTISPSPPSFHPTHPILQHKAATNGAEACSSHAAAHKGGQTQSKPTRTKQQHNDVQRKTVKLIDAVNQTDLQVYSVISSCYSVQWVQLSQIEDNHQPGARTEEEAAKLELARICYLKLSSLMWNIFSLKPLTVFIFL